MFMAMFRHPTSQWVEPARHDATSLASPLSKAVLCETRVSVTIEHICSMLMSFCPAHHFSRHPLMTPLPPGGFEAETIHSQSPSGDLTIWTQISLYYRYLSSPESCQCCFRDSFRLAGITIQIPALWYALFVMVISVLCTIMPFAPEIY